MNKLIKKLNTFLIALLTLPCTLAYADTENEDPSKFFASELLPGDGSFSIAGDVSDNLTLAQSEANSFKSIAIAITSLGVITVIIALLINITKLGAAGDNAQNRQKAVKGILISGIALAVLGSLDTVLIFLWNFLAS